MWVHENCGGKVSIYLSADEGLTWSCGRCGTEGLGDDDLRSVPKDFLITEKIREWALEGVNDDQIT
jgi:hypothetical protein